MSQKLGTFSAFSLSLSLSPAIATADLGQIPMQVAAAAAATAASFLFPLKEEAMELAIYPTSSMARCYA